MNKQDFGITNGFPLNQAALDRQQTAYSVFNALGNIVGDKTIISGCVLTGSNVSNGVVFVNNEVFEFRGGTLQTKVIIKEDIINLEYKNGNTYPAVKIRYVTFGVGSGSMDWADFTRGFETKGIAALIQRIEDLEARPLVGNIPVGLIAIWGRPANEIPAKWEEYTQLAGRVPIGFDSTDAEFDVVLKPGGSKTKVLEVPNLPKHKHGTLVAVDGGGGSSMQSIVGSGGDDQRYIDGPETGETGGNKAFSVMNPFRTVHFIRYKG